MDVSSITGSAGSSGVGFSTDEASERARLSQEQFLSMLIGQMQNQDPLEPMDNSQFLDQLMQMQNLETSAALTDGINSLLKFQSLATASSMLGDNIEAIGDDGSSVSGTVDRVSMLNGEVKLFVGGIGVSLGNVQSVSTALPAAA